MSFVHHFFPAPKADKPFLRYSLAPCGRSSQRDECANGQPRLGDVGSDGFWKVWPVAVLWLCPCGSLWRLGVRADLGIKSTAAWMVSFWRLWPWDEMVVSHGFLWVHVCSLHTFIEFFKVLIAHPRKLG